MHDGVQPCLEQDDETNHLMDVNVVVKGQYATETEAAKGSQSVAKNQNQNQDRIKEQRSPTSPRQQVEWIWGCSVKACEVPEVVGPVDEQDDIDDNNRCQETGKYHVMLPVGSCQDFWYKH